MNIFWVKLSNISYKGLLKKILKFKNRYIIFTPNPEILLNAKKDKKFKALLNKADFLLPDGIGLYIAYQIKTSHLTSLLQGDGNIKKILKIILSIILMPYFFFNLFFRRKYLYERFWERICWSDLTEDLVTICEEELVKITIIDLYNPWDKNKVASQKVFMERLQNSFPWIKADYHIYEPDKKQEIISKIKKSKSKVLFSTLWMKKQEESVVEIMEECENIKLWLWIWSSFDYLIWFQQRAPKIFSTLWIEWLYRLVTWPRKIDRLRRLWNAIFVFIWEVLKSKK